MSKTDEETYGGMPWANIDEYYYLVKKHQKVGTALKNHLLKEERETQRLRKKLMGSSVGKGKEVSIPTPKIC